MFQCAQFRRDVNKNHPTDVSSQVSFYGCRRLSQKLGGVAVLELKHQNYSGILRYLA